MAEVLLEQAVEYMKGLNAHAAKYALNSGAKMNFLAEKLLRLKIKAK